MPTTAPRKNAPAGRTRPRSPRHRRAQRRATPRSTSPCSARTPSLHGFPAGIEDVDGLCRFHASTTDTFPDASVTLDDAVAERDRVATRFTWRASQGPGLELIARGGAIVRFDRRPDRRVLEPAAEIHAVTS